MPTYGKFALIGACCMLQGWSAAAAAGVLPKFKGRRTLFFVPAIARRPEGWWNETRSACTCCRTVGPGLPCRHAWPSAARAGVVWNGRLPKFSIEHCRLWLRGVTREPNCPLRRCRCCRYDITDHVSHKLLNRKAKCTCICLSSCLDYFVFYTHVYMAMHLICYSPN